MNGETFHKFSTFIIIVAVISTVSSNEEVACEGMSIHHYVQLKLLAKCTVVLGNLTLLFPGAGIDVNYKPEEINSLKLPLREVVGYMMIHDATHLNSLGGLFPNLTIIRGQTLFSNYAFMVYSADIREISTRNLLKISRGSVIVAGENPRLCIPNKIAWERIIVNGKFKLGLNESSSSDCSWMRNDRCESCSEFNLCWSNKDCQRFESTFRKYFKKNCHPLCLGDCVDQTSKGCYTCQDIRDGAECVDRCPEHKVLDVITRRCISASDCSKDGRTIYNNEECVLDCPKGFAAKLESNDESKASNLIICVKCNETCPRTCDLPRIQQISQLESFGIGCTIITGDLDINIIDDIINLSSELKKYLGDVELIQGMLKIHRSPPITDMTFLNNLRVVEGRKYKASIQIFENSNLQTLFDWKQRGDKKLTINIGHVLIYNNIMLCSNETNKFQHLLEQKNNNTNIIDSNGLRNKCSSRTIETSSFVLSHQSAQIRWKDVNAKDKQVYNAYIVQYVALRTTIEDALMKERDTCSSYGWQQVFVTRKDFVYNSGGLLEVTLTNLEQYTTYAFLVQTYHNGPNETEYEGTISEVNTFRTRFKMPSRVQNLRVTEATARSLTIDWNIFENERDSIEYFFIDILKSPFNVSKIDKRDYCLDKLEENVSNKADETDDETDFDIVGSCCDMCCKINRRFSPPPFKDIAFEDKLLKFVDKEPRKNKEIRSVICSSVGFVDRVKINSSMRSYTFENLQPYTPYMLKMGVCKNDLMCSEYEIVSEMTSLEPSYDRIDLEVSSYGTEGEKFQVFFDEPTKVNGAIVSYLIEVKGLTRNSTVHLSNSMGTRHQCLTRLRHELDNFTFSISGLTAGTYAFRVMAVSLAGRGLFTEFHEFSIVPPQISNVSNEILISLIFLLFIVIVSGVLIFYFNKRLITCVRPKENDREGLIKGIELQDFRDENLRDRLSGRLPFILEVDDSDDEQD